MPPRKKKVKVVECPQTNISKSEYINMCVDRLLQDLPSQTFSYLHPVFQHIESDHSTYSNHSSHLPQPQPQNPTQSSSQPPLIINQYLCETFPIHREINVRCYFCQTLIDSTKLHRVIEQPQSRRRFTPICDDCFEIQSLQACTMCHKYEVAPFWDDTRKKLLMSHCIRCAQNKSLPFSTRNEAIQKAFRIKETLGIQSQPVMSRPPNVNPNHQCFRCDRMYDAYIRHINNHKRSIEHLYRNMVNYPRNEYFRKRFDMEILDYRYFLSDMAKNILDHAQLKRDRRHVNLVELAINKIGQLNHCTHSSAKIYSCRGAVHD